MAITPHCDRCKKELRDFGAILLSPPDAASKVLKFHVCKPCYEEVIRQMGISIEAPQVK